MQSRYVKKLLGNKVLLILVGFLAILFCIARHAAPTSAETLTFQVDNTTPILEVTVPSNVYLNLAPTSGAAFGVADLTIGVGTNNPTGYTLSMNVDANNSALVNDDVTITPADYPDITVDSSNHPTIETLAQSVDGYTQDTFPVNKWGIRVGTSGNFFRAVFATAPVLSQTSTASNSTGSEAVVQLAAKVDSSQPIGAYHTTINFIAVTNPLPKVYMQSMVLSDCHTFPTVVYDSRDEQPYKVAKLADGQCWMVKNLNLAGGTSLSYSDTAFEQNYTLPTTNGWTVDDGKLVLPASSTTGFSTNDYAYVYNSGRTACDGNPCYSYYSWDAATVGSGRGNSDGDAPYSICPKHWHLPFTSTAADDFTTDFRGLMVAYGGSSTIQTYDSSTIPTGTTMYGGIGAGTTPNFVLAGRYTNSAFGRGGSVGRYWSATIGGSASARILDMTSSVVAASVNDDRSYGLSVRCVYDGDR